VGDSRAQVGGVSLQRKGGTEGLVGLRAFSVSLGCLMVVSLPCVLIVTMLLSEIIPHVFPVLTFVDVIVALLLALGQADRIYEWWLRGYPDCVLAQGIAKSEPKRPLKERIRLWWLRGYDNYERLPAYQKLTKSSISVEQNLGTVEHDSERVEQGTEILSIEEATVEHHNVNEKARVETVEPSDQSLVLPSEKPSKEDLDMLKQILGIEKGCPQYKERGDGVWLSVYDRETRKKRWTKIGAWSDLKNLICQEALPKVTPISDVSSRKEG